MAKGFVAFYFKLQTSYSVLCTDMTMYFMYLCTSNILLYISLLCTYVLVCIVLYIRHYEMHNKFITGLHFF